jgi:hypothetical protein
MNFRNRVFWVEDSTDQTVNFVSGGTVFIGQAFQLTDCFTLPTFATVFDQYCIYSVVARFTFEYAANAGSPGEFLSVIDFDSATAPAGPGALEAYSSFEVLSIGLGTSQIRYIEPCVTPFVFQSGTVLTSFAVARQWIDCSDTAVPHYGMKYMIRGNVQTVIGKVYLTYVCGFRNKL